MKPWRMKIGASSSGGSPDASKKALRGGGIAGTLAAGCFDEDVAACWVVVTPEAGREEEGARLFGAEMDGRVP